MKGLSIRARSRHSGSVSKQRTLQSSIITDVWYIIEYFIDKLITKMDDLKQLRSHITIDHSIQEKATNFPPHVHGKTESSNMHTNFDD
jgi:hypothetical protein